MKLFPKVIKVQALRGTLYPLVVHERSPLIVLYCICFSNTIFRVQRNQARFKNMPLEGHAYYVSQLYDAYISKTTAHNIFICKHIVQSYTVLNTVA